MIFKYAILLMIRFIIIEYMHFCRAFKALFI